MSLLMVYGATALAVLAVVSIFGRRHLRSRSQWLAAVAAAALWPVMALGLLQFVAVRMFAEHLRRTVTPTRRVTVESEPATMPMDLVDSFARLAQPLGAARPA